MPWFYIINRESLSLIPRLNSELDSVEQLKSNLPSNSLQSSSLEPWFRVDFVFYNFFICFGFKQSVN